MNIIKIIYKGLIKWFKKFSFSWVEYLAFLR